MSTLPVNASCVNLSIRYVHILKDICFLIFFFCILLFFFTWRAQINNDLKNKINKIKKYNKKDVFNCKAYLKKKGSCSKQYI